ESIRFSKTSPVDNPILVVRSGFDGRMETPINAGRPFLSRNASEMGLLPHRFRRALREHRIRRLFHGVYVDVTVPDSRELRVAAAKLVAPPHAILCDEFAAWVYGVDTFRPGERHALKPTFVVPHHASRMITQGI